MLQSAKRLFLLLVLSLPLMKLSATISGLEANASDLLFLPCAGVLALAVLTGRTRLRWHPFYAILIVYFLAMLASALVSPEPARAAVKLVASAYLLGLAVLACQLIDGEEDLRRLFRWWLAASALVATVGVVTVLLFAAGIRGPLLHYGLHEYGTLAPGRYPRIEATFEYPALLCNYLTVSLMLLLVSRHRGWIRGRSFWPLLAGIAVTAAFSLTPGLGGFLLAVGLWSWLLLRDRFRGGAAMLFAGGVAAASLFLVAASVTPILHPTAPFLIDVPGTDVRLAPSVRMMTWLDAGQAFLAHPWLGLGLGMPPAHVFYIGPAGAHHLQTDAHNVFLNLAAQSGLVGLAALLLLIGAVVRETLPLRLTMTGSLALGLGLAWLNAFAYQGLTGSYEDARHLWVLLGLFLAAARLRRESAPRGVAPQG
ncbi:O-antigen ligase [Sphingosinicella sp. BN140058]|uniref:O-antigen ligase family protein n=1 Tax=Sphingosinicella sp. BN140058 TaxID=1892855 RepID=UPI0013EC0DBE|nr:O-antigen ligase family protein [Sphingosinicella sp. BN140058]